VGIQFPSVSRATIDQVVCSPSVVSRSSSAFRFGIQKRLDVGLWLVNSPPSLQDFGKEKVAMACQKTLCAGVSTVMRVPVMFPWK
jgi:hypothetical protein